MKQQTNQSWQFLLATIIMLGVWTSTFSQQQKPDFSAMEQWYEIVKYDYDFSGNFPLIIVVVKKKVRNAPIYFRVGWFDADGIRVGIDANLIPVQGTLNALLVGEPFRLRAYAPAEKDMPKVKSTVVKRVLDPGPG